MDSTVASSVMAEAIRKMVSDAASKAGATAPELDSLVRLFLLGIHRNGDEDPRAMVRSLTDPLLEHMVRHASSIRSQKGVAMAAQFLVMEWCFRNGHLMEDWVWRWKSPTEGEILYNPRVPLESIAIPSG